MGLFQSKSGFPASLENLKSLDTLGSLSAVGDGLGWRSAFSSERTWLSCPGYLLLPTPSCFRHGCFLPGRWGLWACNLSSMRCTENLCYCNLLFLGVGRHSFSPLPHRAKSFWLTLPRMLWPYSILTLLLGLPFRRRPELSGYWVHRATSYTDLNERERKHTGCEKVTLRRRKTRLSPGIIISSHYVSGDAASHSFWETWKHVYWDAVTGYIWVIFFLPLTLHGNLQ